MEAELVEEPGEAEFVELIKALGEVAADLILLYKSPMALAATRDDFERLGKALYKFYDV